MICPPGKSMIFYKKETEKIELVARPGLDCACYTLIFFFPLQHNLEIGSAVSSFKNCWWFSIETDYTLCLGIR